MLGLCAFFLLLRWLVIEGYHVPTASMEPTLRGDPNGDKVFVNKLAFLRSPPRRWQIVVFNYQEPDHDPTIFVKRLLGLPGETIEIRDGDVYVDGSIARKPRDVQEELLFPVYRSNFSRDELTAFWSLESENAAGWDVVDGHLVVRAGTSLRMSARSEVRDRYDFLDGPPSGGDNFDSDLAVRLRVRPLSRDGDVVIALAKGFDRFELMLEMGATSRAGTLRANGKDVTPIGSVPLETGREAAVLFWNVDGELRVEIDGRPLYAAPYVPTRAAQPPVRHNDVGVEVNGAGAEFSSLELSRDVYYTAEGDFVRQRAVRMLPSGDTPSYFFLGDNSPSSKDSRQWGATLVSKSDLIGTPFMIFWPPSRIRLLRGSQ
ncbi:MAG: signal peptidase I [Planctomycetes bacterium]|nr:signal peptidase I [Planctomycetota bacterium]MBI3848247.1 signal peptidase I [Planctomycetota bacterium]